MPYVERIIRAGKTVEVERYFTSRYKKKGIGRGDKVKATKEQQKKVNTRQAERKLRILINANFAYGDFHLVLDYIRKKGQPDRTKEQMRHDMDIFLRELRKQFKTLLRSGAVNRNRRGSANSCPHVTELPAGSMQHPQVSIWWRFAMHPNFHCPRRSQPEPP